MDAPSQSLNNKSSKSEMAMFTFLICSAMFLHAIIWYTKGKK